MRHRIDRIFARDMLRDWDEEKHPRGKGGKFTKKGSAASTETTKTNKVETQSNTEYNKNVLQNSLKSSIMYYAKESREASTGIANNKRLYQTTPEIQNFTGVESAVEYFKYTNRWGDVVSPIDAESFKGVKLQVLKEFSEGLHWAQNQFGLDGDMPKIEYATLPTQKDKSKTLGDYDDKTRCIRLRRGIEVEYAFTTGVHEMAHHADNVMGHPSKDIVDAACKDLRKQDKRLSISKLKAEIAGSKYKDPAELLAYSVERYCVGKGNDLAKAISKEFLRRCQNK